MTNTAPRKPKEIAAIVRALKANAKEAGLPARLAAHASYQEYEGKGEWVVGANYEDGSSSLVLRDSQWFYRDPHTGSDSPCKGGYDEAFANTQCWFTG